MTTRDELVTMLADIEHALNQRTEVWRTVVDANGKVIKRFYCGAYVDNHRVSHINEPRSEREQT